MTSIFTRSTRKERRTAQKGIFVSIWLQKMDAYLFCACAPGFKVNCGCRGEVVVELDDGHDAWLSRCLLDRS